MQAICCQHLFNRNPEAELLIFWRAIKTTLATQHFANKFFFLKRCGFNFLAVAPTFWSFPSHIRRKISAANETCCYYVISWLTVISYDRGWSKNGLHQFAPFSQLLTIPAGFVCQRLNKKKTNCSFATSLGVVWNVCGFLIRWRKRRWEGNSFVPLSSPCLPSLKRISYPCLHYSLKRVSDRYWWGIGGTLWWQVTADLEAIQMLTNTLPNVDK